MSSRLVWIKNDEIRVNGYDDYRAMGLLLKSGNINVYVLSTICDR